MKANAAPEKIILSADRDTQIIYNDWATHDYTDNIKIEYIRTDVFIEKACDFLRSYRQNTCDGMGYIAGIVNDKTIEDFKNYMKKE